VNQKLAIQFTYLYTGMCTARSPQNYLDRRYDFVSISFDFKSQS